MIGINPSWRACLIVRLTLRWFFAQSPLCLRGFICPVVSLMKYSRSLMFVKWMSSSQPCRAQRCLCERETKPDAGGGGKGEVFRHGSSDRRR